MLLTDGLLVPPPSIALGPRGSQHKRDFLGLSALLFLHSDFQALLPEQNCKQRRATEPLRKDTYSFLLLLLIRVPSPHRDSGFGRMIIKLLKCEIL